MKKLAVILLLFLFVFNTVGYRLLFNFVQNRTDAAFVSKLDKGHYDEADLVAVKVPISLPYQNNWSGYERVDGEINFEGKIYKYVKRTVQNDTMILLCIPHEEKTAIQENANSYFGNVNDIAGNNSSKKAVTFRQFLSDFEVNAQPQGVSALFIQSNYQSYSAAACLQQFIPLQGQPPEPVC